MGYGHYLVRVQTTYHFRYTLPIWAIGNPKPIHVKRSLAIHDAKNAKKFSRHLATKLDLFIATSSLEIVEMNQDERKRVLFAYLDQQIQEWKSLHANGPRLTKEQHQESVKAAQASRQDILWDILSSNLKPSLEKVRRIYEQNGISDEADKNDAYDYAQTEALFHQFVEMTLSGRLEAAQRLIERNRPSEPTIVVQPSTQEAPDAPLISTLIEEYLIEHKDAWTPRTLINYTSDLNVFQRLIADVPINRFTKHDASNVREKLKTLPKNNSKSGEPISSRRANNLLTNISSFFSWCEKERDLINSNVFYGKSLPVPNDDEGRERFTEEDLLTIFTNKRFTKPDKKRMFNYWVPIIAYYSGMRLAEISFLRKQDIIQVNGIWAFAIKPFQIDDKKRTIKNKKSTRTIPIHSDIIKLGFLDYVESCKGELLFDTKRANHKHDDAIGKSFGVFKKKLGLPEGKVFHSFRMTFMDIAAQQNLDLVLIKDFVGHSHSGDVTLSSYVSRASVERLNEQLLTKIKFPLNLLSMLQP